MRNTDCAAIGPPLPAESESIGAETGTSATGCFSNAIHIPLKSDHARITPSASRCVVILNVALASGSITRLRLHPKRRGDQSRLPGDVSDARGGCPLIHQVRTRK